MSTDANTPRRFAIALSFPGEHRAFVEQVAGNLAASFSEERVLYDKYHDAEFARADLDVYLPGLYRTQSELIVIFLCPEYAAKRWCKLEWRHIRQLITTADEGRIMFLSFGNPGDLSGLGILSSDGYIDILQLTPKVVAEKILKRLRLNQGITLPAKSPGSASTSSSRFEISRILKYAPAELIGRGDELKLLNDAWFGRAELPLGQAATQQHRPSKPKILTLVALGGEGKTALVAKWAAELAAQNWPGCDAAFAWSFYSQGTREQQAASSDLFLKAALTFFASGDEKEEEIKALAASNAGAHEKGQRLASLIGKRHCLLILDGLEPLQYAPTAPTPGELKDQGLAALLKGLAAASHGLCVVTTRYSLPDLKAFRQTTAPEVKLLRLSRDAGVHLLKTLGVRGTAQEFATLVEDVKGHALTLTLLGSYLAEFHAGDIRKRDLVKLDVANEEELGGHTFHVLDAYVNWLEGKPKPRSSGRESAQTSSPRDQSRLTSAATEEEIYRRLLAFLRLMGLFDRPATVDCLSALWKKPVIPGLTEPLVELDEGHRNSALKRLEAAKLLTVNRDASGALVSLDAHPHLREYFARQLRTQQPDAWRAAHRRLYEHLCASTPDKPQPTLEDLQPLYQAVAHGCQAGLQQEACDDVFFARIRRSNEDYAAKKLGAFGSELGAVACFFDPPWSLVSPALTEADQAWMLGVAPYDLRALGRLTEALEPMRTGLEMAKRMSDVAQDERTRLHQSAEAAVRASNLSELELTLGEVAGAVGDAEQSVTYADRSGKWGQQVTKRATHADALHQAGRRAEAEKSLREAEEIQKKNQPDYPLLYSLQGFRYCDLLLAAPERAAWQWVLESRASVLDCASPLALSGGGASSDDTSASEGKSGRGLPHSTTLREVRERATQTLKWVTEGKLGLLDIALDHLTLGRGALYAAILSARSSRGHEAQTSQSAIRNLPSAMDQSLLTSAATELDAAVSGLRHANRSDYLPRGLLTRAWLRSLTGACTGPESAQADLDEVWEIAERGPMRLFLADIHLYRVRLFGRRGGVISDQSSVNSGEQYPWESAKADLAEARRLILKHSYLRRLPELEDAEEVILG